MRKQRNIGRRRLNAIDAFKIASILLGDSVGENRVRDLVIVCIKMFYVSYLKRSQKPDQSIFMFFVSSKGL